jgi:hypothetical protein
MVAQARMYRIALLSLNAEGPTIDRVGGHGLVRKSELEPGGPELLS